MITPNDFRIGNTLLDGKVVEIHQYGLVIVDSESGKKNVLSLSEVKPLVITEDILASRYNFIQYCGATESYLWIEGLPIRQEGSGWRLHTATRPMIKQFNYLHELENLYFAFHQREIGQPTLSSPGLLGGTRRHCSRICEWVIRL